MKVAALIMLDLDNLKHINDTYGHDYGDEYIRCAANVLKKFIPYQSVIARMSGDEFYAFFYGYENKDQIRRIVEDLKETMKNAILPLPDNHLFRVRASGGIAWYPDDSTSYEQLIKYVDFAMYSAKNNIKGEFSEFDISSYHKEAYLLHNQNALNRLIEEELVEYYFQPIVNAADGTVFAYEALMRSKISAFKSPVEILALARSQSKLYQIERLTWFKSLEAFDEKQADFAGCKLFINSISNQILSDDDISLLEQQYLPYLKQVVVELTEEEKVNEKFTVKKQQCSQRWNAAIALDDFGTGYNGESVLLSLSPNYVKIDMSIVRGIDSDESRQKIFQNLVSYSHERGIKVIAEGIETHEEMVTLLQNGVDYMQGYYLGLPHIDPLPLIEERRKEILAVWETIQF